MKRWALGESLRTLLVSCYCYSKLGQAWFFKTIQIYNLKVLEARSLHWARRFVFLLEVQERLHVLCFSCF